LTAKPIYEHVVFVTGDCAKPKERKMRNLPDYYNAGLDGYLTGLDARATLLNAGIHSTSGHSREQILELLRGWYDASQMVGGAA
jgi:hypothetical protein